MTSPLHSCDCGCGRTFRPPTFAPHKRFATPECRNRWHLARRKEGLKRLAAAEAQDAKQQEDFQP